MKFLFNTFKFNIGVRANGRQVDDLDFEECGDAKLNTE